MYHYHIFLSSHYPVVFQKIRRQCIPIYFCISFSVLCIIHGTTSRTRSNYRSIFCRCRTQSIYSGCFSSNEPDRICRKCTFYSLFPHRCRNVDQSARRIQQYRGHHSSNQYVNRCYGIQMDSGMVYSKNI